MLLVYPLYFSLLLFFLLLYTSISVAFKSISALLFVYFLYGAMDGFCGMLLAAAVGCCDLDANRRCKETYIHFAIVNMRLRYIMEQCIILKVDALRGGVICETLLVTEWTFGYAGHIWECEFGIPASNCGKLWAIEPILAGPSQKS